MQRIDFLPQRYREQTARHRTKVWQLLVVSLFGAVIAATAVAQHMFRRSVEKEVEAVDFQHALAQFNNTMLASLQSQLTETSATADLYAYLQHPWPRTQILAAVIGPLPESASLKELAIVGETEQRSESRGRARNPRRSEGTDDDAHLLPAQRDLKQLQEKYGKSKTVVHLSGTTTDTIAFNRYIGELETSELVLEVEASREASREPTKKGVFEFEIRVIVRDSANPSASQGETAELPGGARR